MNIFINKLKIRLFEKKTKLMIAFYRAHFGVRLSIFTKGIGVAFNKKGLCNSDLLKYLLLSKKKKN